MPELPEVETIKNELSPTVLGRYITGVTILSRVIVREPSPADFSTRLLGLKVTALSRRGKYLILSLSNSESLIIHLKLAGSLFVSHDSSDPPQFTKAVIELNDGTRIYFRDPRGFGRMWLVKDCEDIVGYLGPEPFEPVFTPELLARLFSRRRIPIKALLLDQDVIAGIGNMYADEALFAAGIHPLRTANSLSREEIERLYHAIREVLAAGIKNRGASVQNYFRPDGSKGAAHLEFKVARQKGQPCPRCGTKIERIVVRGRGTYFCPGCQR